MCEFPLNEFSVPLPDEGWSKKTISLQDAIVAPPQESRPRTPSGIWKDGDIAQAAIWRLGTRMTLPLEQAPTPVERLEGNFLFGGMYYGHFGHFITETICRLWAAENSYDGIIFTPKHAKLTHFKKNHREIFKIFGITCPMLILGQPTLVESITVPGQGFGLGDIARGTDEYREFLRNTVGKITPDGPEKIYISRTQYVANGGLLGETVLEENLKRSGYVPVYPEKLSWAEQLALYRAARKIISADTSALHMAGMAADPDKDIAVILRRNNAEHHSMRLQLQGMTGKDPLVINSLDAEYLEPGKKPNHNSWGQVNFTEIHAALLAQGYLDPGADWDTPSDEVIRSDIAEAERRAGRNLVHTPVTKRFGQ